MLKPLKRAARAVAPEPIRHLWGTVVARTKERSARRAFEALAPGTPARYLDAHILEDLMGRGYEAPAVIRYDPEGLVLRAVEKVEWLARNVPMERVRSCVELGCYDGMVLASLHHHFQGIVAFGADRSTGGIDPRARAAGVRFLQTDASQLAFDSGSLDLVYSFAAFEHFADPGAAVDEAWRVLRPGGHLYLSFGPVYTSPFGLHAYRQIPVPYCHYLFSDAALRDYATSKGLPTAWPYVNGVTVTEYRRIFAERASRFDRLYYHEHPTGAVGAEFIIRYPSCFRARVPTFDELLVSAIEICLRKR
jgi:SAM-dependent methyltransferase